MNKSVTLVLLVIICAGGGGATDKAEHALNLRHLG